MMTVIASALSGLKEATSLIQGFNQLKTDLEVAEKTIALNQIIVSVQHDLFTAQASYAAAISRIDELEKTLMQMEDWAAEKHRYELYELRPGTFTYRLKKSVSGGEPIHDLCPQCYHRGIKSILQFAGAEKGWHKYSCHGCNAFIYGEPKPSYAQPIYLPEPDLGCL